MTTHELKVWRAYFVEIARGEKTLEIRFGEDRDYRVGDQILFREWEHGAAAYTGRWLTARVAACTWADPPRFGARGERTWALQLAEVGAIREGVVPSPVPVRIDLGLAPAGVETFEGWEAWEAWVPAGSVQMVEKTSHGPLCVGDQTTVTLCRIPFGAADKALKAWVQASMEASSVGRLCVLRLRRGAPEEAQKRRTLALTHAFVVRAKPGGGDYLYRELDVVGLVAGGEEL
jgi:hypothetical protein